MRIAQLAPLAESVPPKLYGGTERVIAWLVDELVDRGHDVTLFASGDSSTKAKLHAVWPRALRLGRKGVDPNAACALLIEAIGERARDFDVIHSHVDWLPLPVLGRTGVPFLTTMHGRLDLPGLPDVIGTFPKAPFVSISDNQRRPLPDANWIATIPHGLPKDLFRPSYEAGSYLAFLGRLTAEKGPEAAIRIARAVQMPLRIAAKIPRAETAYFKKKLEPEIDGETVQLIGEVDELRKQPFLAGASALLFPIDWPEPFGLVMIEAMACGTPVIAYRSGSVPEVVEDGVTGFIVDGEQEAIEAVEKVIRLDRRRVRARFEERFVASRMAKEYEERYRELVAGR
ncbi:glycosyltransferase involved in cell wall biosynthesis [Bradyrhizobium huanghuaihaiense]|uniref:Glycosyl transferase n=3 Tax=Bradyrhizobium TaxID=374 RepID=A0A410UZM8_9BRAD|nr:MULTISPECIES: glycosyltransferase family 4 protein [Bradyrhizobium]MBR1292833.1 glycosyltransferase family 4 protein [Bradyrhizobium ottawaense]MBR1335309.1 glycosyltransferase family 4 protein [Bradyrhizobium ottawaense]PDT86055.1 glycosyltransferase family 4 protein [Bradyrhizobium sp. Y36]QAU36858.1 glycosyltransferase family 4 protein [Bradyrhizobium guangdongense]QOZ57910.1 glycosyltransferase family 4 protein [Bradyrhizobium guangdongense]